MGAAAIGVALWRYHMRFNPANPEWFARDRTSESDSLGFTDSLQALCCLPVMPACSNTSCCTSLVTKPGP